MNQDDPFGNYLDDDKTVRYGIAKENNKRFSNNTLNYIQVMNLT